MQGPLTLSVAAARALQGTLTLSVAAARTLQGAHLAAGGWRVSREPATTVVCQHWRHCHHVVVIVQQNVCVLMTVDRRTPRIIAIQLILDFLRQRTHTGCTACGLFFLFLGEKWLVNLAWFFNMRQICDMGQTALLPLRRKACCGFVSPEKSDGFGRVFFFYCTIVDLLTVLTFSLRVTNMGQIILLPLPKEGML
jgi:hypothetical protein